MRSEELHPYTLFNIRKAIVASVFLLAGFTACEEEREHTAPAIHDRDSVSMMTSYGVNTLISDSGVIKYKIVAERWDVNTIKQPTRWTFIKGIFMEQFDEKFHVQAYVQADTAWYYDQKKLWELRGRVRIRNVNGLIFRSEELFWDGSTHELYSHKFSKVITPERTLQGTYFKSNEQMTMYTVNNSKGSFEKSDMDKDTTATTTPSDSTQVQPPMRERTKPKAAMPKIVTNE